MIFNTYFGKLFNLSEIIKQAKEGKTNIGALTESVKAYKESTTIAASATQVLGTTLKSVFFSSAITLVIGALTTALFKMVDSIIHYKENIREAAEEAMDTFNELNSNLSNKVSITNNVKERYAELSQKVNQSTGENKYLSNDEYQEYLDISKQLLEVFPELYGGITNNGDAFISLSGDVNTVIESLDNLIQKEKELSNLKMVNELPDIFNGINIDITDAKDQIDILNKQREIETKNIIEHNEELKRLFLSDDSTIKTTMSIENTDDRKTYSNMLKDLGIQYTESLDDNGYYKFNFDTSLIDVDALLKKTDLDIARLNYEIDEKIKLFQNEMSNKYIEMKPLAMAWVSSDYLYQTFDESVQNIIDTMVSSLDFEKLNINDETQMIRYITNNILNPLYSMSPEVSNAFSQLFDMQDKLNNGEISNRDFTTYATNMFYSLVNGMSSETASVFKDIFVQGFNNIGIDGVNFYEVVSRLVNSWNTEIDSRKDDFNFFDAKTQESINKYKEDLNELTEWQTEYLSNGFLSDGSLYELQSKFKGVFDFSDFNLTNNFDDMFYDIRDKLDKDLLDPLYEKLEDLDLPDEVRNSITNFIAMIKNMAAEATGTISSLKSYSSAIDDIQNAYNTVSDAIDEYNENQYISLDTMQSLLSLDDQYLNILFDENGQLQLNKETYKEIIKAKLMDMYATLEREAIDLVSTLKSEEDAIRMLKNTTVDSTNANWDSVNSIYEKAKATLYDEVAMSGEDADPSIIQNRLVALNKAQQTANARVNLIKGAYSNISKNIDGMFKGTKKTEKETKKFTGTIDWLNNSVENLSNSIDKLNTKLNDNTLTYNQRVKIIKELIAEQEKLVEQEKKGVSTYKNQYDNKLNALGSNKDKYKKLIESNEEIEIESFTGKNREKVYNAAKEAQEAWKQWQEQEKKYQNEEMTLDELQQKDYENRISFYDNRIARFDNDKQDAQNSLDLKKTKGENIEASDYQNIIDKNYSLITENELKLDEIQAKREKQPKSSERYRELNDDAQAVQDTLSQLKQEQIELNREMLKLPIQQLEEEKKLLEEHLELLNEKEEKLNTSINAASKHIGNEIDYYNNLKETTSDTYDLEIKKWQDKIDLLTETNDEIKQQIDLEKAQYDFEKAINNKNVKIYREGVGFVYESDQDAVRDTKRSLEEQQFNKQIRNYEKEIKLIEERKEKELESIDAQIESLTEYKELLDSIFDVYEDMLGLQQLVGQFGADVIDRLNAGDLSLIEDMTNRFVDTQSEKASTEEQIDNIDINIEEITNVADAWNGNIEKIDKAKKQIEGIVSDNSKELEAIKERTDAVASVSKQWSDNEISIKSSLDLINTDHTNATTKEQEILNGRLENLKSFAEQAKTHLDSVITQLDTAKEKESELNITKQNIENLENDIKNHDIDKNKYKKHTGMKTGFVGENLNASDKEMFRYISLNNLDPNEVPAILKLGESVLTNGQQANILNNMRSSYILGTQQIPNIQRIDNPLNHTFSFNGDIIIEKINGDVDEFAQKVKSEFLSRLEQQLYKL